VLGAAGLVVIVAGWSWLTDGQAPYGDDNSAHLALMMHIGDLWRSGVSDLWWNQSNLGLPLFMAYQPLPALVSGSAAAVFPETSVRILLYKGSILGLWATMPAAWYLGGRWLGMDRMAALLFGLGTLALRDIHSVGFGFTAASYGGLYTQIWGMWFLPVTLGAFRRYVSDRSIELFFPVALFVVLSMSHLFCGMYAGIAGVFWVVVDSDRRRAARRALHVFVPALALLAFWFGPLLWTSHLTGGLPWKTEYYDGWPAVEMFRHLLGGDVFDWERLPWLTVLVFAGVFAAIRGETERRETWVLTLGATTLVLFLGRTNFGGWYDWIPMHADLNVMRYINGVHFCGLALAAFAGRDLVRWVRSRLRTAVPADRAATIAALVAFVVGGWFAVDRYHSLESTLQTFDQGHPNVQSLIEHLEEGRGQRFAVSDDLHTTPHFYRDLLPALAGRAQLQSYALGYHATLSTYYADYIEYDATWARLFNVGTYVARQPFDAPIVDHLPETFSEGPYRAYAAAEGADWGYFDFVRTPARVEGGYREIRPAIRDVVTSAFERRVLPILEGPTEASREAGTPLLRGPDGEAIPWESGSEKRWVRRLARTAENRDIASRIRESSRGPNWYRARVTSDGDERLLLKANYFPFWRATVDGEPVTVDHVAPNFMAVSVPKGEHRVRFTYRNPWWQKLGAVSSLLVLAGWSLRFGRRRWR